LLVRSGEKSKESAEELREQDCVINIEIDNQFGSSENAAKNMGALAVNVELYY
jgi:hypothetical protein